jgi:hypothetical protein
MPCYPIIGRNGAWEIGAEGKFCSMRTMGDGGTIGLAIMKLARDDHTVALIYSKTGGFPQRATGSITDTGTGELLFIKTFERLGDDGMGAVLSMTDLIKLWGDMLMDSNTARMVTVKAGNVSFQIDIHGAVEAYQNLSSCAG